MFRAIITLAFQDKVQCHANDIDNFGAKLYAKESYCSDKIRARRQEILLETLNALGTSNSRLKYHKIAQTNVDRWAKEKDVKQKSDALSKRVIVLSGDWG